MKIKRHHKVLPHHHEPPHQPEKTNNFDPVLDWDNLCKNVKNFWEDLFEDISN